MVSGSWIKISAPLIGLVVFIAADASAECREAEACNRQGGSGRARPVFIQTDLSKEMTVRGRNCVKRYGVCVGTKRPSTSASRYRTGYVDAQRRDRQIVSRAAQMRARDEWEDARGSAMYEAYGTGRSISVPTVRIVDMATRGANAVGRKSSSPGRYDALTDRANLKAAESEYDRRARMRPRKKED